MGSAYSPGNLGANKVFIGNGDTTSTRNVTGTKELPQGYSTAYLRTSGASGKYAGNSSLGEISPDWISLVDQIVYFGNTGLTIEGLTVAEDASECVSPGDSGGAVYLQSGTGNAIAVGVISGTNGQGAGPANCRNYYSPMSSFYVNYWIRTN